MPPPDCQIQCEQESMGKNNALSILFNQYTTTLYTYIYIYIRVCACVCDNLVFGFRCAKSVVYGNEHKLLRR